MSQYLLQEAQKAIGVGFEVFSVLLNVVESLKKTFAYAACRWTDLGGLGLLYSSLLSVPLHSLSINSGGYTTL
jgi:hypothetical protein